ncbi:MAG: hypothetical protein V8S92_04455 [Oscillospiraceae bacterium]
MFSAFLNEIRSFEALFSALLDWLWIVHENKWLFETPCPGVFLERKLFDMRLRFWAGALSYEMLARKWKDGYKRQKSGFRPDN